MLTIQNADKIQNHAKAVFTKYFADFPDVKVDCGSKGKKGFRISSNIYSPEPDIRVGPFAIENMHIEEIYDKMAEHSKLFINNCISKHTVNLENYHLPTSYFELFSGTNAINPNARCFIAVEIEASGTSRKHKLGSILNAIALGRVGLLIGLDPESLDQLLRAVRYLYFINTVKSRIHIDFRNGLFLLGTQFTEILNNLT